MCYCDDKGESVGDHLISFIEWEQQKETKWTDIEERKIYIDKENIFLSNDRLQDTSGLATITTVSEEMRKTSESFRNWAPHDLDHSIW